MSKRSKKNNDNIIEMMDIDDFLSGTVVDAVKNDISLEECIKTELISWGLDKDSFTFKALYSIIEIKPDDEIREHGLPYDRAIEILSEKLGKSKSTISSVFANAAKNTDFSGAKFIPILKNMDREDITKEFLVKQIYDFVLYAEEE